MHLRPVALLTVTYEPNINSARFEVVLYNGVEINHPSIVGRRRECSDRPSVITLVMSVGLKRSDASNSTN